MIMPKPANTVEMTMEITRVALDIDARVARDLHILTDRAHILTELGAAEPEDQEAGGGNDNEREHGDLHAADADRQQVIQALAHIQQAHRIPDTVAARELERIVDDGNDGPIIKSTKNWYTPSMAKAIM